MAIIARAQTTVASAPGTGGVTFGGAVSAMQTWAAAGAVDGATYSYLIEEGTNWEYGRGTYSASGTLSRTTILGSSNGNAAVNFGGGAIVSQVILPPDVGISASSFRNRLINGNFAINQRGAGAASASYSAGAYILDRWKAGGNGCTMSFSTAANGDVTVSITAGTLVQIIEGPIYMPEGGSYVLSWSGSATARVYQGTAGSFAGGPIAVGGLTAGTNTMVEFTGGTVTLAQLEPGSTASSFERRDDELYRCARYAQAVSLTARYNGGGDPYPTYGYSFYPKMRAQPGYITIVAGTQINGGSVNAEAATSQFGGYYQVTGPSGAGWYGRVNLYTAEL